LAGRALAAFLRPGDQALFTHQRGDGVLTDPPAGLAPIGGEPRRAVLAVMGSEQPRVLLTYNSYRHTSLNVASNCRDQAAMRYLVDLRTHRETPNANPTRSVPLTVPDLTCPPARWDTPS
jgi:hypothetical protein